MKKKLLLVMLVLLLTLVSGNLFAQVSAPKNWVYGQVGLINFGLGYERQLTPRIGLGIDAYWNSFFIIWNTIAGEVYGKFYLYQGLYAKLGLGGGYMSGTEDYEYTSPYSGRKHTWNNVWYSATGFIVEPGLGWKIDVGKRGGFFVEPKIGVPILIGKRNFDWGYGWFDDGYAPDSEVKVGFNVVIACGLGYAF